jgi:hypothetical protein
MGKYPPGYYTDLLSVRNEHQVNSMWVTLELKFSSMIWITQKRNAKTEIGCSPTNIRKSSRRWWQVQVSGLS